MSVCKKMSKTEKWEIVLDRRIAPYFKLYSDFLNFETYFLIAHRKHISIFYFTKNEWSKLLTYDNYVRYLSIARRGGYATLEEIE
jgi:hypothetical protein